MKTDYRPQFIRGGTMESGGQNSISPDFICGEKFKIGSFCVIEENVVVGNNVTIGNLVVIKSGQRIPDDTVILDHIVWI